MATARKPPWRRPNPKSAKRTAHLTAKQIAAARRRAKEAGRRYPNLVDNMWAARYVRKTHATKKPAKRSRTSVAKKAPGRKTRVGKTARKKTARKKAASGR